MNQRSPKKFAWQPLLRADAPAWLLALALGVSSIGCNSGLGLAKKSNPPLNTVASTETKGPLGKVSAAVGGAGKSIAGVFRRDPSKTKKEEPVDPIALNSKMQPPGADFYVTVAQLKERAGDLVAAQEQYNKAMEMEKNYLPAMLGLARLYDNQGMMQKATETYQRAVKMHPKQASAHNDLGLCYARQNRYAEAAAELNRAVELQPDRPLYHNNLATILVELDRPQEAFQQLCFNQKPAIAHYNLGYLLSQRGKHEAAAQQFAKALEREPGFDAARQSLDQMIAMRSGGYDSPIALQPEPYSLPGNDQLPDLNIQVSPQVTASPHQQREPMASPMPVESAVVVNDGGQSLAPMPPQPPVRPVRDLAPLAPLRSEAKVTVPPANVDPAMPPLPDQWKDSYPASDANQARLQPLPPVEKAYFPPSRF